MGKFIECSLAPDGIIMKIKVYLPDCINDLGPAEISKFWPLHFKVIKDTLIIDGLGIATTEKSKTILFSQKF